MKLTHPVEELTEGDSVKSQPPKTVKNETKLPQKDEKLPDIPPEVLGKTDPQDKQFKLPFFIKKVRLN